MSFFSRMLKQLTTRYTCTLLFSDRVVLWPREVGKAIATGSGSFPNVPNEVSSKERISTSGFEMSKILWSLAWLLLMIFVAWPLAYFLGWWWIIIMPFENMIEARKFSVYLMLLIRPMVALSHYL